MPRYRGPRRATVRAAAPATRPSPTRRPTDGNQTAAATRQRIPGARGARVYSTRKGSTSVVAMAVTVAQMPPAQALWGIPTTSSACVLVAVFQSWRRCAALGTHAEAHPHPPRDPPPPTPPFPALCASPINCMRANTWRTQGGMGRGAAPGAVRSACRFLGQRRPRHRPRRQRLLVGDVLAPTPHRDRLVKADPFGILPSTPRTPPPRAPGGYFSNMRRTAPCASAHKRRPTLAAHQSRSGWAAPVHRLHSPPITATR
jgi:hypothetical protein